MDDYTFEHLKLTMKQNGFVLMDGYPVKNGSETIFRRDNVDIIIKEVVHKDNL